MSKALELAAEYADAAAKHLLESLYGTSNSYTLEVAKYRDEANAALTSELLRLAEVEAELEAIKKAISEAAPIGYLYHDASAPENAHPWLHSTMIVMAAERRKELDGETPLYTLKAAAEAATPGPWIAAGPSFGAPKTVYLNEVVTDYEDEDDGDFGYEDEDDDESGETICQAPSGLNELCSAEMYYIATANPAAILELLEENAMLLEALKNLLKRDERNTCNHDETHRGGAIWTICSSCNAKWADDEGGKPDWKEPPEWTAAFDAIKKAEGIK